VRSARSAFLGHQSDNARLLEAALGLVIGGTRKAIFFDYVCNRSLVYHYTAQHFVLDLYQVARIEKLKGQKYLIEACGKQKSKIKDFQILLVGEIVDNSYKNECIEMAIGAGIHDRVNFTGPLSDIRPVLNETDIFVLPSLFEAFPRSIIEAMAAGIPVIATDVGGNTEAIENNVSGFIIPLGDSDALAEKIYLLAQNLSLRLKMGAEARNRAVNFFGIRQNVKKTESL